MSLEPWQVLGPPRKQQGLRYGHRLRPPVYRQISNGDHRKIEPITPLEGDAAVRLLDLMLDVRNRTLQGTSWIPLLVSLKQKLEAAGYANPYPNLEYE